MPAATEIIQRVAANQDRAEAERTHYVYVQHARVASMEGKRLMCEEVTDSRVLPQASASERGLLHFEGRFWRDKRYVLYGQPLSRKHESSETEKTAAPHADPEIEIIDDDQQAADVGLVESLRSSLMDRDSKDGFAAGLFPLSTKAQDSYDYRLLGRERMNGRDTFHLSFTPRASSDYNWAGDVWVDTEAFQPVLVRTRLSRNVPFLVKTMLGTNVPGLGFAVTYAPQPDGVWFPATFGTEFKIHLFFFYTRQIIMSAQNRDFQRTHVESSIVTGPTTQPGPSSLPDATLQDPAQPR